MNYNIMLSMIMVFLPYELKREEKKVNEFIKIITPHIVTTTTYEAVVGETDSTPLITASGFKINPERAFQHRIIAVSRDLLKKFPFGTKIRIIGADKYDGTYIVQDVMNKRYRNTIDILIGEHDKQIKLKKVKMYKL